MAQDRVSDYSMAPPTESTRPSRHTGLQCLVSVAGYHGLDLSVDGLSHKYAIGSGPISQALLLRIAREAGLRARVTRLTWKALLRLDEAYPALIQLANSNWVIVVTASKDAAGNDIVRVLDPLAERPQPLDIDRAKFCANWRGDVMLLKRTRAPTGIPQSFSFRWFIPELLRERRIFADVAVAAVLLYALGLVIPIFFQLVIDKVLVHESFTTLYVLAIGVVVALIFDGVFTFLRRFLLLYATNKVDIRVATKTFGHLLGLPISFFEHISAGVLVKHMQQAARIREFLTGRLFLTMLDAVSLLVFVPVLTFYSLKLTFVVLAFTALIGVVITLLVGPFRRRLLSLYQAEAERQGLLVETVHGMRTVKSLAMEPLQGRVWNDRSAQAVSMRFDVEKISAAAQSVTGLLEKLMSVAIIGLGAIEVFNGDITIGALVAFNMLAGRVSGPLVQMVTMIHEYQEVALAVRMLGEVMN